MRAAAVTILASAVLLLFCCLGNRSSSVSLYQPRYPPSNFRQGPHEFSPYSLKGGLPPVYSQADVSQRNVWQGFNTFQPLYSAYSYSGYTPSAVVPVPLAPSTPLPRQRYQMQMSSRYYSHVMKLALRRINGQIDAMQQQIFQLKNVVAMALKHPISHGELIAHAQRQSSLGAISSKVHQLQIRVAKLEANSISGAVGGQGRRGPVGPQGPNRLEGAQGVPGATGLNGHTGGRGRPAPAGPPLTPREARHILDAVTELRREMKLFSQRHKTPLDFSSSALINHFDGEERKELFHNRKELFHNRRISVKSISKARARKKTKERVNGVSSNYLKKPILSRSNVILRHSAAIKSSTAANFHKKTVAGKKIAELPVVE
jgi:hypothetical protein